MFLRILLAAALALLPALQAGAAAAPAPAAASAGRLSPSERHDWERSHRTSRIVGTPVRTRSGETIGSVRDLVLDNAGNVRLAIVSTGSFLGAGETLQAVPWDALGLGPHDDLVLDIDKSRLAAAPHFTSHDWPDLSDPVWQADNRRHYER